MAAITCRLWMLSVACCLAAWPGARAGADVDGRPPSPAGDEAPPPQVYTAYPLAYTEDPASSMLVQAVASAEPPRVQLAQTPVETVQDSVQGTVWLLVLCAGVMVLAGFNSRKPRPPHRPFGPLDPDPGRLNGAADATETDDATWRRR